jgi:hypothetical protein
MPAPVIKAQRTENLDVNDYFTVFAVRSCHAVDGEEPELGAVLSK